MTQLLFRNFKMLEPEVGELQGGFELLVPDTWNVIIEATPFLGGIDVKARTSLNPSAPRLIVRGFVMMGGLDIKN